MHALEQIAPPHLALVAALVGGLDAADGERESALVLEEEGAETEVAREGAGAHREDIHVDGDYCRHGLVNVPLVETQSVLCSRESRRANAPAAATRDDCDRWRHRWPSARWGVWGGRGRQITLSALAGVGNHKSNFICLHGILEN